MLYTKNKIFKDTSNAPKPTSSFVCVGDKFIETDTLKEFKWDGSEWIFIRILEEQA